MPSQVSTVQHRHWIWEVFVLSLQSLQNFHSSELSALMCYISSRTRLFVNGKTQTPFLHITPYNFKLTAPKAFFPEAVIIFFSRYSRFFKNCDLRDGMDE